ALEAAAAPAAFLADADPFRVVAVGSERTRARRPDPLRAALVARTLLGEALLQCLHQLVPAAQRLHQRFLFLGERALHRLANPFFGNPGADVEDALESVKVSAEGEVEAIVERFVLDEAGARQVVEIVDAVRHDVLLERFEQRQKLTRGNGKLRRLQVEEKVDEHDAYRGRSSRNCRCRFTAGHSLSMMLNTTVSR